MERNGTPASPATQRASSVFPVPGGPEQQHAFGDFSAEALELLRVLEKLDYFLQLGFCLVKARGVGKGVLRPVHGVQFRPALAETRKFPSVPPASAGS